MSMTQHHTLVEVILEEIEDVTGRDPIDQPPLYESIDTEALESLYSGDDRSTYPAVWFSHAGCLIEIDEGGNIVVTEHETKGIEPADISNKPGPAL